MDKKVLILHASGAWGGAELSLTEILDNLPDKNTYSLLLAPGTRLYDESRGKGYKTFSGQVRYMTKKDIRGVRIFSSMINIAVISFGILRICRQERINVILCNTHRTLIYVLLSRIYRRKVVCVCRDNIRTGAERTIFKLVKPEAIAISEHIASQLPDGLNVNIIHNCITGSLKSDNTCRVHMPKHGFLAGSFSNIHPWKNLEDFIRISRSVVAKYPESMFFIAGSITDKGHYKKLVKDIEACGLTDNLTFLGYVENPADLMAQMDILIHTAIGEPFGRVVVEAMLYGKPAITYDSGCMPEIIEDGRNGYLITEGDTEAAAERVCRLIEDRGKLRELGHNAARYADAQKDMSEYIEKLENILDR